MSWQVGDKVRLKTVKELKEIKEASFCKDDWWRMSYKKKKVFILLYRSGPNDWHLKDNPYIWKQEWLDNKSLKLRKLKEILK